MAPRLSPPNDRARVPTRAGRRRVLPAVATLGVFLLGAAFAVAGAGEDRAARVEAMYAEYKAESFPDVPDISADDAQAWCDSAAVVLLDVRSKRERRVSVLPGALDEQRFQERLEELADRPVLVYCTIGYRSGLATRELRERGIEAYNLIGGILAWSHAGGVVLDREGEPTRRVHVYGGRWNLLPEGWDAVLW